MFQWIANLLLRRRVAGRRSNGIFRYFDGHSERGVDPCWAFRRLTALHENGWEWSKTPKAIDPPEDDEGRPVPMSPEALARQTEAIEQTLDVVRRVFAVQPYDHQRRVGLTDAETLALLVQFGNYLSLVKKNGSTWPTSPPATAAASSVGKNSATPNSASDSGSTLSESRRDADSECSSELSGPSETALP